MYKVVRILGLTARQTNILFFRFICPNIPTIIHLQLCYHRFPSVMQKNSKVSICFSSVQQTVLNIRSKNHHSKRIWETVWRSGFGFENFWKRQILNHKFYNMSVFKLEKRLRLRNKNFSLCEIFNLKRIKTRWYSRVLFRHVKFWTSKKQRVGFWNQSFSSWQTLKEKLHSKSHLLVRFNSLKPPFVAFFVLF